MKKCRTLERKIKREQESTTQRKKKSEMKQILDQTTCRKQLK